MKVFTVLYLLSCLFVFWAIGTEPTGDGSDYAADQIQQSLVSFIWD